MIAPPGTHSTHQAWFILGCGYTGTRLARHLLGADHAIPITLWATRRTADDARALAGQLGHPDIAHTLALDTTELARASQPERALASVPEGALVVHAAPPAPRGPSAERAVVAACHARGVRRIVYVSSTSMYPPGTGDWITEDTPAAPASDQGEARFLAETALLEAAAGCGLEAVSLRVAGIYGPGRGVHARLVAGNYRVIGAGDTFVNRIHVDDLVAIIARAATIERLPRTIYNVADDHPETSRAHADAVAEILGLPPPPSVPASDVAPWVTAMLGANRRISSARLQTELGVTLRYPSWREGLQQCLAEDGVKLPS